MRRSNGEGGGVDKEGDATVKRIWAEWNSLSDDELSPVKTISSTLGITNAEVAEVVYPADQFGPWADDQEPMRPSFPTEDVMLFDSTDPTPRPMKNAVMVELGFISRHGFELVPVEVLDPVDDGDSWTGAVASASPFLPTKLGDLVTFQNRHIVGIHYSDQCRKVPAFHGRGRSQ